MERSTGFVFVLGDGDTWDGEGSLWVVPMSERESLSEYEGAQEFAHLATQRIPLMDLIDAYNEKHGTNY